MKVIFLDIDGVLNTSQTFVDIHNEYKKTGIRRIEIDINRLILLKKIVEQTGAVIVLSSSLRKFGKMENGTCIPLNEKMADLIKLLKNYGLNIYDITPIDAKGNRQNEIDSWLKDKNVESFIILDDCSSDLKRFVNKELIKTNFTINNEMNENIDTCAGLCEHHVIEAIKKLNLTKKEH